jgi:hypothetical protein
MLMAFEQSDLYLICHNCCDKSFSALIQINIPFNPLLHQARDTELKPILIHILMGFQAIEDHISLLL